MTENSNYIKARIGNYVSAIASLSNQNLPAYKNAANGWFRERMLEEPITRNGNPPTIELSGEHKKLYEIYTYWFAVNQRAFKDNGNFNSNCGLAPHLIFDNLGNYLAQVLPLLLDVISIITGDDDAKKNASANLIKHGEDLLNEMNNRPMAWSGQHMSGWVSVYARDAANWTVEKLNAENWTDQELIQIINIFKHCLLKISNLKTDGHEPWLLAEWQVQYQLCLESMNVGFNLLQ